MNTTAIVDLSPPRGLIAVSGKDATPFLQGLLTCDVQEIGETALHLGAFCNLKGRIRALLHIFKVGDIYYLQLPIGLLETTLKALKKYALFSKVKLEEATKQYRQFGVFGSIMHDTHTGLKRAYPNDPTRFEIFMPFDANDVTEIAEQPFDAWVKQDIQMGIPEVWAETTELLLPHTLGLPQLKAVSFTKGCYCGQEIIARMEYRGTPKRHMRRAVLNNSTITPQPGMPIYSKAPENSEAIGMVISVCTTDPSTKELLIEMPIDFMPGAYAETIIHLEWQANRLTA